MKLSLQTTMVFAAIFAALCLGVGVHGFLSLADVADATQLADARGFAWFWTLLGAVGAAVAVAAWRTIRHLPRSAADGA